MRINQHWIEASDTIDKRIQSVRDVGAPMWPSVETSNAVKTMLNMLKNNLPKLEIPTIAISGYQIHLMWHYFEDGCLIEELEFIYGLEDSAMTIVYRRGEIIRFMMPDTFILDRVIAILRTFYD